VPDWLLWLILAALLAVGEVLTLGFLLGLLALAAVAAGIVAALGGGLVLQFLVFIGASVGSPSATCAPRRSSGPERPRSSVRRAS
jgi:membrane protein implicated in regulation of membrane protease activity